MWPNKRSKKEKIDVFIHIPKAAGSSVRSLIETNYPVNRQVSIYRTGGAVLHDILSSLADNQLETGDIVYGHIPVVVHNYTDRHCDYFTFLREPIDRVTSFFKFVKYDFPDHPNHMAFKSGAVTFKMFCNRNHIEANKMTQMLSGFDRVNFCNADMLESAKKTLKNLKFLGFFDEFSESVHDCGKQLGWNMDGFEVRNISSKLNKDFYTDEGVNDVDIQALKKVNRFDVELYEFALDLREKRRHF